MSMNTFPWEDGTVVERPYVEINGTKYYVQDGIINGGTPATANNLNEMQDIINDNIEEKVDGRNYVAWQNSNPTQSFIPQQISLDKSMIGASHYEIEFFQSVTSQRILTTGKIPNGYGTILHWGTSYRATDLVVEGDTIRLENAYEGSNINNNVLIPYRVIFHYDNLW